MLAEIQNWLEKPEFSTGTALYKKYGSNKALVFFFENRMYGLDRLIDEIKKIDLPAEPQKHVQLPPVIRALIDSKNIAWKEASDLHARLMGEPDKSNRYQMALRITELSKIFKDCWAKIDQYETTGDYSFLVPEKTAIEKPDLYKLFTDKQLKNNYIIKAKKELNNITDAAKKEKKAAHLATLENDLKLVDERIAFLNKYIIENNL